ncbi:hypothetical protein U1Q18_001670 [Sarracenia purpurea var. burkii]
MEDSRTKRAREEEGEGRRERGEGGRRRRRRRNLWPPTSPRERERREREREIREEGEENQSSSVPSPTNSCRPPALPSGAIAACSTRFTRRPQRREPEKGFRTPFQTPAIFNIRVRFLVSEVGSETLFINFMLMGC